MKLNISKDGLIDIIEVINDTGLSVFVSNLGASIYEIKFNDTIVNYGPKDLEAFKLPWNYHGKTIGRYAGRIGGARWRDIEFDPNDGRNLLHGGKYGLSTKIFKYRVDEVKDAIKVTFSTIDSGKKSGFPGKLNLTVIYKIYKEKNKLEINFKSKCSEDCPINLTNHAYFNLGSNSIEDLKLKIDSSKYIKVDNELIAEDVLDVDKVYDFRRFKKVTRDIGVKELQETRLKGYDNLFIFDNNNLRKPKLIIKNDEITMKLYTDFPAAQIYTNNYPSTFTCLNDKEDIIYGSVAIEPQLNTYRIENTVLKAGEVRKNKIIYTFDSINK